MPKPLKLKVVATGQEVAARVERISPAFDPATRKIKVDLLVAGGLHPMRGGVRLELTLNLPDSTGAVFLPSQAVTERYQEHWVTPAGGKPFRVVILGKGPNGALRVTAPGLAPGRKFELPE
jgi:hypothetical protein